MPRRFHIERIEDPNLFAELVKDHIIFDDNPLLRKFSNYFIIREDFRTIIELNKTIEDLLKEKYCFLKLYLQEEKRVKRLDNDEIALEIETYNTLLIQSLFTTTVVTYAKWFTQSYEGKKPKLETKDVYKNGPASLLKIHRKVMDYRHTFFAHGGTEIHEEAYPLYLYKPEEEGKDLMTVVPKKKRIPSLTEVKQFYRLFTKAFDYVYDKSELLRFRAQNIMKQHVQTKSKRQ